MPERGDLYDFAAGPASLPTDVLQKAAESLVNYQGTGIGIGEHSRRSQYAKTILEEAKADLASYLDVPSDYEILFMHGGGTGQFLRELVDQELKLDYLVTGSWSLKDNTPYSCKIHSTLTTLARTEIKLFAIPYLLLSLLPFPDQGPT